MPSETRDAIATKLGPLEALLALPDADIIHAYKEYASGWELRRSPDLVAVGAEGMDVENEEDEDEEDEDEEDEDEEDEDKEDEDEEDEDDAPLSVRFGSTSQVGAIPTV